MRKVKSGFTLVELLVVIAIISILSVITAAQFQTARQKANDVARKGDLSALSKALMMYYNDYSVFPATIPTNSGAQFDDTGVPGAAPTPYIYMKVTPKEKYLADYPFCYVVDDVNNPKKFALLAELENKADSDCKTPGYPGCSTTYCYAITSSNTTYDSNGNWQ